MTPTTELERLAVVETEIKSVKTSVERIEEKLDDFAACKADKSEVEDIAKKQAEHTTSLAQYRGALIVASALMPILTGIILLFIEHFVK